MQFDLVVEFEIRIAISESGPNSRRQDAQLWGNFYF
jgi:hypothetical protein